MAFDQYDHLSMKNVNKNAFTMEQIITCFSVTFVKQKERRKFLHWHFFCNFFIYLRRLTRLQAEIVESGK
jgi:hypothetical protein